MMRKTYRLLAMSLLPVFLTAPLGVSAWQNTVVGYAIPSQTPRDGLDYEAPPETSFPSLPEATPAPNQLSEKELKRAEALLPLLAGRQELYIMGEFVHLGKPVVPILVKALKMSGTRLRYNAIETLSIIKGTAAVPNLLDAALDSDEVIRVRERALRVAVKLDPIQSIPALKTVVSDGSDTMRRAVAYLSRFVPDIQTPPLLIQLLGDKERYVSATALDSFWRLTRFGGEPHDWQGSTQEQRKKWALEWKEWWETTLKNRPTPSKQPSEKPVS